MGWYPGHVSRWPYKGNHKQASCRTRHARFLQFCHAFISHQFKSKSFSWAPNRSARISHTARHVPHHHMNTPDWFGPGSIHALGSGTCVSPPFAAVISTCHKGLDHCSGVICFIAQIGTEWSILWCFFGTATFLSSLGRSHFLAS